MVKQLPSGAELRKALDDRGISIHTLTLKADGQPTEAAMQSASAAV